MILEKKQGVTMKKSYLFFLIPLIWLASCGTIPSGDLEEVKLKAGQAELQTQGALVLGSEGNVIGWWESTDDIISWEAEITGKGTYQVQAIISCDPQFPGSQVQVAIGEETKEFIVPDTGAWENYTVMDLGEVKLTPGTYPVRVQALSVNNRFVCNLKEIRLTPN